MEGGKGGEEQPKDGGLLSNDDMESSEAGMKELTVTSPKDQVDSESAPVKRSHSTEDDPVPEENRKKRRKEGGENMNILRFNERNDAATNA